MADRQRIYSDDEFTLVLRTAAELASRAEQRGFSPKGLTLGEMKAAAAQAGFDPALVERAARQLGERDRPFGLDWLLGGPLRHEYGARFAVTLGEDSAARVLAAVRISATHYHSSNAGHSSALGMTWRSSGEGDVLSVVARPDEDGTSVSVVIDRRATFILTGAVASIAVFFAFVAGIGLYDAIPRLAPWIPVAGVAGVVAAARGFWAASTRKTRERIAILMDAIGQVLVHRRAGDDITSGKRRAGSVRGGHSCREDMM